MENAIKRTLKHFVIVIRAPPLSGKSTLLDFIGAKMLIDHPELAPVKCRWPDPDKYLPTGKRYGHILDETLRESVEANPPAPGNVAERKIVYLIDDAHNTYLDPAMWEDCFKRPDKYKPFFILVCPYGAADRLFHRCGKIASMAADIPLHRRIELHQLFLNDIEMRDMIDAWAKKNSPDQPLGSDLLEFFRLYTNGHVGVLDSLLRALEEDREKGSLVTVASRTIPNLTHHVSR